MSITRVSVRRLRTGVVYQPLGNVAVMLAALGVLGTGSAWPDLIVAGVMATLALTGGAQVLRQARTELRAEAKKAVPAT